MSWGWGQAHPWLRTTVLVSSQLVSCQGSPHAFTHSTLRIECLVCFRLILGTEDSVMGKPGRVLAVKRITALMGNPG